MTAARYALWEVRLPGLELSQVDEGREEVIRSSAGARNTVAHVTRAGLAFLAAPAGQKPSEDDIAWALAEVGCPPKRDLDTLKRAAVLLARSPKPRSPDYASERALAVVTEAYELGRRETAEGYRRSLGKAWSAFLGMVSEDTWIYIKYTDPETWQRLREVFLGDTRRQA